MTTRNYRIVSPSRSLRVYYLHFNRLTVSSFERCLTSTFRITTVEAFCGRCFGVPLVGMAGGGLSMSLPYEQLISVLDNVMHIEWCFDRYTADLLFETFLVILRFNLTERFISGQIAGLGSGLQSESLTMR